MSRCFPYPPPGYVWNGASGDTLIDSIKLQREKEKAEIERKKERKREKKEKKRKEKEKRREKHGNNSDGKEKRPSDKRRKGDRSWVYSKEMHLQKKPEDVAELLENSDLSEEHEQPNYSGNLCYTSDGTQSGIKRKMDALPSNGNHSHGNIIQIRSPLVKHKEADAPLSKEQPCTKSGSADSYCQEICRSEIVQFGQEKCCSTSTRENTVAMECTPRIDAELLRSTSGKAESLPMGCIGTALESKPLRNNKLRKESLYKALTENWVPTPLHHERVYYDDGQQWLFEGKHQDNEGVKRLKASKDVSCRDSFSLGPHAHYLLEADIYALPYTIPF